MSKKQLSQSDYDHLIGRFAQQLWFLRERWKGIMGLRDVNKGFLSIWAKYRQFFDSVYRSFVYDFYVGICRLVIDDTKGVESMIKLLKKKLENKPKMTDEARSRVLVLKEMQLIAQIKENRTIQKIKNQRDCFLAHQNSDLLFDEEGAGRFRKENNPSPEEIDLLMHTLDEILTQMASRASFYPLTAPNTSIRREIEEIFAILDKE